VSAKRKQPLLPLFKREERHEFRYQLSVFFATSLSWLFWLIPRRLRYAIADRVGDVFRRTTHTYRDNVESNISQVLGLDRSSPEVSAAVKSIFRTSSRNFTDLITMPRLSRATLLRSMRITRGSWDIIEDAIAEGKGVIFVSAHLGCFDLVGQVFWARGYKLTIVTGRTTSRFIFDGVTHLRGSNGTKLVEPTPSGVRQVIRALRNGECSVFVTDRDFFQNGRPVEFFGRATTLPPGAVRIARDTGAIVVPIAPSRTRAGHELEILEPFTVPKTHDLEADMEIGFEKLISAIEYAIRKGTSQWVMFQRVWPVAPPPAVRVFPVGSPLESELLEKVAQALPEMPLGDRKPLIGRKRRAQERAEDGVLPSQ
jgi:KDO2-lipid IV(A) lauroyltransferase